MLAKYKDFKKIYFYATLVFAFILPLSHAGISFFSILLPLIWIIEGGFKEKFKIIFSSKVFISLLLFLSYSILSILWSSDTKTALNILRLYGYFLSMFVIATSLEKKYITKVISAFLAGMFISEMISYGVFFELWHFKNATVYNPTPFMMHIDYSVFLAFSSILLLDRVLSENFSIKEKLLYFFFFLTVTGNLFLSIGRTGQVAYIVAIFVLMILKYKVTLKSFVYAFLTFSVVFFSAYNLSHTFQTRVHMAKHDIKLLSKGDLNSSWGIRVAYWIVSYEVLKKHPFGVGLGDYKSGIKKELNSNKYDFLNKDTKDFMKNSHPHNQYLLVLLQTGVIGIVLFLCFIYQTFKIKISDKSLKNLSILFFTVFYISCFAEPLFIKQFTLNLYVLFVGLFLAASFKGSYQQIQKNKEELS